MQVIVPGAVPAGCIVMWAGTLASIPAGWLLCDGSGGTPDLRSVFVKGAAAGQGGGATGGGSSTGGASSTETLNIGAEVPTRVFALAHTHGGVEPPFYACCFIQKS